MKFFSKNELLGIGVIVFLILVASFSNFRIALRRSRDAQRRADLGSISDALGKYQLDFGLFPLSSPDNNIMACKPEGIEKLIEESTKEGGFDYQYYYSNLKPCEWGIDGLRDFSDESYSPYLETLPIDPRAGKGFSYAYLSNGKRFQIYAYLEGENKEVGYSEGIVKRSLICGPKKCNYGKAFGKTPLEKSIEEYENELIEKSK